MVASPALGLDITSIGVITSIFPLCYGCSKFVSGVVGDVLSPSVMLGGGLIATGMVRSNAPISFSYYLLISGSSNFFIRLT
jgi:sugar phosphate permease